MTVYTSSKTFGFEGLCFTKTTHCRSSVFFIQPVDSLHLTFFLHSFLTPTPHQKTKIANATSSQTSLQRNTRLINDVAPTPLLCLHSRLSPLLQNKPRQCPTLGYWLPLVPLPPCYPRSPCNRCPSHHATLAPSIKEYGPTIQPKQHHRFPKPRGSRPFPICHRVFVGCLGYCGDAVVDAVVDEGA